jgi:hypothetical protein
MECSGWERKRSDKKGMGIGMGMEMDNYQSDALPATTHMCLLVACHSHTLLMSLIAYHTWFVMNIAAHTVPNPPTPMLLFPLTMNWSRLTGDCSIPDVLEEKLDEIFFNKFIVLL